MVSDDAFAPTTPSDLAVLQALVIGLDRHIELMGRLEPTKATEPHLTPRETLVLALMTAGRTAAAIAVRLQISPRTVHKLRAQGLGLLPPVQPETPPPLDAHSIPATHSPRYPNKVPPSSSNSASLR